MWAPRTRGPTVPQIRQSDGVDDGDSAAVAREEEEAAAAAWQSGTTIN